MENSQPVRCECRWSHIFVVVKNWFHQFHLTSIGSQHGSSKSSPMLLFFPWWCGHACFLVVLFVASVFTFLKRRRDHHSHSCFCSSNWGLAGLEEHLFQLQTDRGKVSGNTSGSAGSGGTGSSHTGQFLGGEIHEVKPPESLRDGDVPTKHVKTCQNHIKATPKTIEKPMKHWLKSYPSHVEITTPNWIRSKTIVKL